MRDGIVYVYNGAYWKELSKQELMHFLGQGAENLGVRIYEARYHGFRADLLKQFVSMAYLPTPEINGDEVLINLANGTFVVRPSCQFLKGYDRKDFLTYQLPFEMDASKEAPLFREYLDKVLPDKNLQMILAEFIGYVFVRHSNLKLEKSLILFGTGANGKSVFFDIITALLGPNNVSNFSLQSLTNESGYHRAKLANMLVNYASEISPRMDSTVFKQLVSGEPVEARLPYGQPFTLADYAKLIFNTNELPKDVEQNEAFFRRFVIINFAVTIPADERDTSLARKIISGELPGVFNWVLEGLKRLLYQKKLTQSDEVDKMIRQYRQQSDSVQLFLHDEDYEKDVQAEMSLKVLYNSYKTYCTESNYKTCSLRVFVDRLKNLDFVLTRKKKGNVIDIVKNNFNLTSPAASPSSP
jgi:putative DNA primase/helicase